MCSGCPQFALQEERFCAPCKRKPPNGPSKNLEIRITEEGGLSLRGGSRHDWNRHDRRNRQNRQNRHGCLIVLYFVGQLRWRGDSQRESGRFAPIDSPESIRRKILIFITFERFEQIASNLWFALFSPQSAIRNKGVQFGKPETIRENQAIRANLRIDSRESGHLSRTSKRRARCSPEPPRPSKPPKS